MSRYVVGELSIDSESFDAMCEMLGEVFRCKIERTVDGTNGLVAFGYHGDSREAEIGKVAAIVQRQHIGAASNDLPIRKEADGTYKVVVSEYDLTGTPNRLALLNPGQGWEAVGAARSADAFNGKVRQLLGVRKMTRALDGLGYKYELSTDSDGSVRVLASGGKAERAGRYAL